MFNHLTDLGYKRNFWESLGFYITYFFLGLFVCGLSGAIVAMITKDTSFATGVFVGSIVAIIYCFSMAVLIIDLLHDSIGGCRFEE